MKTIFALIFTIAISYSLFGQSVADSSKKVVINGEIKDKQYLIKDYLPDFDKKHPIYWVEISVLIEKNSFMNQPFMKNITTDTIPGILTFTSNSSGLKSDLDIYDNFKIGEKVSILAGEEQIIRFLKNENNSITILSIE